MKKLLLLTAAFFFVSYTAVAQNQQNDTFPEALPQGGTSVVVFNQTSYEPTVSYRNDVVYAQKNGKDLHLQIITPYFKDRKPLPCIVYVQGSAWMKQNVYSCIPSLSRFAQKGYVVAVVEYRDTSIEPFPAQTIDAKTAIRFMRKNAARYNIDPEAIAIWGDSSGGHTSLMVAVTQDDEGLCDDDMYADVSCKVKASIAYYPPTDISVMKDYPSGLDHNKADSPEGLLIGGKDIDKNMDLAKKASPLYYLSAAKSLVPVFLAAGTMDRTVPFSQTDIFAKKLNQLGKDYKYYALKGADHGSWEFWTDSMFDILDQWLKEKLK